MVTPLPRVMGNMCGREDAITSLRCISPQADGCGRQIQPAEILQWDQLTLKEYRQSGWCPACQNRIFQEFDNYDPDMREDEPPHDITEIAWPVGVL